MGTIAFLLCLSLQDDRFRVDGSPFLILGEQVELEAKNIPKDAVVVWRLFDGPPAAIRTTPPLSPSSQVVKGTPTLTVASVGKAETELRFAVTVERKGVRLATAEHRLRVGPLLSVKVWCRSVEHESGGTRRTEELLDDCRRKGLESRINGFLRPLGVAATLEAGSRLRGPEGWFDKEGRFSPIVLKDGKRANSPSLNELIRNDLPGGLNVYFVRDLFWETVSEGFERVVTEYSLLGVGLKEGQAVVDDEADAASIAHELGHALGLDDLQEKKERNRMMYWARSDRSDILFTYGEMKDAREGVQRHRRGWEKTGTAVAAPRRR
jgi:hypothetical protein